MPWTETSDDNYWEQWLQIHPADEPVDLSVDGPN